MNQSTKLAMAMAAVIGGTSYSMNALAIGCPPALGPGETPYLCVQLQPGNFNGADADGYTNRFYELGSSGTVATSIYDNGTFGIGTKVIDTNDPVKLASYGISAGTPAGFLNPQALYSQFNVDALNGTGGPAQTENFGFSWGLTFNYFLEGTITATGPTFTSGYFQYFFVQDLDGDDVPDVGEPSVQVLQIDIVGSQISAANLDLFGIVDSNWFTGKSPFQQNFFNFSDPTTPFSQLLAEISWHHDGNVDPPVPVPGSLPSVTDPGGNIWYTRQTSLDHSARFNVNVIPEIDAVAGTGAVTLLLGSLALAGERRRKARKV